MSLDPKMKIQCPRCNQYYLKKVYIGATDQNVFLCYECEAIWFCEESIEYSTFLELGTYLIRKGLKGRADVYNTFVDDDQWFMRE
jgi:transcription elongation factor Elf1